MTPDINETKEFDLDRAANDFDALIAELTARRAREEAVEAIAAADNTLHSAMDYWQERAIRAEAALRARDAEVGALVEAARRAEVSFNTVGGCYERNPGNFMMAMRELEQDVVPLRAALRPFHPSGSDAEGESK